ncbi:MAG: PilZ domain-containing protein [Thermodesulfobacteriota bacterium]|nr:PilZ domain-containing protein [Thermodesulfobacteriota bacterium]
MPKTDKRKYPRVKTRNVVSYVCVDKKGNEIGEGMGETLNISQGGILLKSVSPIESEFILLMSIDLENNIMEIKGKVAHTKKGNSGKYETGISFLGTLDENVQIIKKFVKAYHSRKNKTPS